MSAWQPIKSAPKNQARFLAYFPKGTKRPEVCMTHWSYHNSCWMAYGLGRSGRVIYEPTHWMPLPEPPKCPG